jgi:hypothetical protein
MKVAKITGLAGAAIVTSTMLTSCFSHATPSIGQCGIVTGRGFGDNTQGVKRVVPPGAKVSKGSSEQDWYVPCNVRNYVTGDGGDRGSSQAVKTANGKNNEPGMPVFVDSRVTWQLFQTKAALTAFFPFCLKYGCADTSPQEDSTNSQRSMSSNPGWNNMLRENLAPALDAATRDALATNQWGPDLWRNNAVWPALAKVITANFNKELAVMTGSQEPYFCAPTADNKVCNAPQILITAIRPQSPDIAEQYNQQVAAENATAANVARLAAARKLYGSQAEYFLGLQDTIKECNAKPGCTIYIGNPPGR